MPLAFALFSTPTDSRKGRNSRVVRASDNGATRARTDRRDLNVPVHRRTVYDQQSIVGRERKDGHALFAGIASSENGFDRYVVVMAAAGCAKAVGRDVRIDDVQPVVD